MQKRYTQYLLKFICVLEVHQRGPSGCSKNVWKSDKAGNHECSEKLLIRCLCSKVTYVKCQVSNAYVDPWEMLNNFCFHVYAQKSLFIGENVNVVSGTAASSARSCEFANHTAGSQLKMSSRQTKAGNQEFQSLNVIENFENIENSEKLEKSLIHSLLTCWTTFVFMSMLKSHTLTL